jgi:lipoprotein-anchoring transpeptidase ErfK/SrfK
VVLAFFAAVLAPIISADVNDPAVEQSIGPGSSGAAVLRAQILLDRAHFSCGEIDAEYGRNLQKTVAAFQQARGLQPTGVVDPATWAALDQDRAPAVVNYTVDPQDVAGPFEKIPRPMKAKAKLTALGYQSPEEELGERFHVSPAVLEALNTGSQITQPGAQIDVPNVLVPPPPPAAEVVVSKSDSAVKAYDASGRLLAFYCATIGSVHDPLPVGRWTIARVQRYPWFHYNSRLFWDARDKHEKEKIAPGPRNPVGVVWIDLSKKHYGIHGTPDPSRIGHASSHGCIRLTNWDAWELANMVAPGTPAILQD